MPSAIVPSPEDLDRLVDRLGPTLAEILREWEIPEVEAEELMREVLVRLSYRWSRIPDPERWLLAAVDQEARSRAERTRKEPRDE